MKADRVIKSAASALGAVTLAACMAETEPVAAQAEDTMLPNILWVASHRARAGVPASSTAPDGTVFDPLHAYSPAEFCAAYNIDQLHAEGLTGRGQTIVIVAGWGSSTALEDLNAFSQAFGLPAADLTVIYPDGTPPLNNAQRGQPTSWAGEISLDLQWAHAIAPEAKLVLIAPHPASPENLLKGVSYAVEHYPGSPISQSWSGPEQVFGAAADTQIAKFDKVYARAVAARCTVLCACNDFGATGTDKQGLLFPYPVVCWPASDPLVTAVGGTWLQYGWRWDPLISAETFCATMDMGSYLNSVDNPGALTEAVWKEDWLDILSGGVGATGGGLSTVFCTPDFQQGLPQALLQGRRGVPDISFNAAVDGGVMVYCTEGSPPYPGAWGLVGGTSASTPELAGLVALVNQLRSQTGKQPIGYMNPVLYTLPARDFNDIIPQTFGEGPGVTVVDDNSNDAVGVPGYKTTAGYDLTTGLGSPNAYWFVHDLADTP